MGRWKPVPGSTDPADYPFLRGMQVPCSLHRAAAGRWCRCVGIGQGVRGFEARWHQQPVFAAVPGVAAKLREGDGNYTVVRTVEPQGHRLMVSLRPQDREDQDFWSMTPAPEGRRGNTPDDPPLRPVLPVVMDHGTVIAALLTWGRDTRHGSLAAGLRSLGNCVMQLWDAERAHTGAQQMFRVSPAVFPHRPDGRFTFAGHTEPYPGAWPTAAVLAAERGDLAALWPYLR